MKPINVANKSTPKSTRAKKQTTLGSFLMKNDSNLTALAVHTLLFCDCPHILVAGEKRGSQFMAAGNPFPESLKV